MVFMEVWRYITRLSMVHHNKIKCYDFEKYTEKNKLKEIGYKEDN